MGPARIKIAEPSPPRCSSCFQAKPAEPHVDFGASYDGPAVPALEGTVGVVAHTIDDLVICDVCIAEAAKLIGLEDAGELRDELEQQRAANDALHAQLAAVEAKVEALEGVGRANEALAALRPAKVSRRPRAKAAA